MNKREPVYKKGNKYKIKKANKNDYAKKVIHLLKKKFFNVKTMKSNNNYTVVQVSFSIYSFYLFIWHKKVINYENYKELCNATYSYIPQKNPTYNYAIKKFQENDHIIVYEESFDDKGDIIEKFVNSNLERTTYKNKLQYNYCNK
ncbi:15401_t:CDS:1, partial [Gigaspora margarita]